MALEWKLRTEIEVDLTIMGGAHVTLQIPGEIRVWGLPGKPVFLFDLSSGFIRNSGCVTLEGTGLISRHYSSRFLETQAFTTLIVVLCVNSDEGSSYYMYITSIYSTMLDIYLGCG